VFLKIEERILGRSLQRLHWGTSFHRRKRGKSAELQQESEETDKSDMRALSIRQPYPELILRRIEPIEFRSRSTKLFTLF
jgi:hypothetical protein